MNNIFRSRISASLLSCVLVLSVAGCGGDSDGDSGVNEDTTPNTLYVTHFSLPDEESVLYEYHSFDYVIGVAGTDGLEPGTKVIANLFLVDSEANTEVDSGDDTPSCLVGSAEIQLVAPGEDVFIATEGRPGQGCYDPETPQRLFSFAVLLESNDTLLSNETLNDDNYVVLTEPMRTTDVNQLCIGEDGEPGCVIGLTVAPSPGLDVGLAGLTLESNIVLNYSRDLNDANTHDEMHTANTEVTLEAWLDGAPPDQQNALQAIGAIQINYAIKPIGLGQGWLPLTVQETGNMGPAGHSLSEPIDELSASTENHFVDSLFIEGETYDAVGPGGAWDGENHFEMRACLAPAFAEADLPTDDEASNNCVYADFFLSERLPYNPDAYDDNDESVAPMLAKVQRLTDDQSVTADKGLFKKLEVGLGDADSMEIGMSFLNQARFGVVSTPDLATGLPTPGSGIPFATLGSTLEAHLDGFIDAELVRIDFTHTFAHKEATDGPDWEYLRSYQPSVMLHLFGIHYVDILGSIPVEGQIDIDNDDLEKISQRFVQDDDGQAPDDNKISFAQDLCEKTFLSALVMEVNVHSCITSKSGVDYGLTLLATGADPDSPFDEPFADAESLMSATVWIDPYAELDWKGGITVDLGLLKGDLDITLGLLKLHLQHMDDFGEFQNGGSFELATGAISEFEILGSIGTQAYLDEEILNGEITFEGERVNGVTIKCCFYPKAIWKSVSKSLYSWDGISIGRQKLWNLQRSDSVLAEGL
ncbi:MAG: hypothetical protein WBP60_10375 [Gammaproteobacteria bacterium]